MIYRNWILLATICTAWVCPENLRAQDGFVQQKEKKFSIHLGTGYTNFTFTDSDQETLSEHNNKWRNTYNYNFGLGYHPNSKWFFNLKGSLTSAYARTDSIVAISPTDTLFGHLEDDIRLITIGVLAERKLFVKENFNVAYLIGLQYFYYENLGTFVQDEFTLTGGDIGMNAGLCFNVHLSERISLNLNGQYIIGILDNPSYTAVNAQIPVIIESQDLSRLEFNIGLRFHIFGNRKSPSKPRKVPDDDDYVPNGRFE